MGVAICIIFHVGLHSSGDGLSLKSYYLHFYSRLRANGISPLETLEMESIYSTPSPHLPFSRCTPPPFHSPKGNSSSFIPLQNHHSLLHQILLLNPIRPSIPPSNPSSSRSLLSPPQPPPYSQMHPQPSPCSSSLTDTAFAAVHG